MPLELCAQSIDITWIVAIQSGRFATETKLERGNPMSYRTVVSIAAAAILGTACVSTEALAYRARAGGVHGVYRGD
jgi:hypothetical protein